MARSGRRKIKLKNPKKLFNAVLLLLLAAALIFGAVLLVKMLLPDSVVREIEKLENQKITIIDKSVGVYNGDEPYTLTTLNAGDTLTFRVSYRYKLENGTIKTHPVESGITLSVSDTAYAGIAANTLTIREGVDKQVEIELILTYKNDKELNNTYKYTILPDNTAEPGDGGTEPVTPPEGSDAQ